MQRATQDTFAAIFAEFLKKHVSKLRSRDAVESAFRRELIPVLGKKPISTITRRDIVNLIDAVVDDGRPYTARHLLAYPSKFFVWSIARDYVTTSASHRRNYRAFEATTACARAAVWLATSCREKLRRLDGQNQLPKVILGVKSPTVSRPSEKKLKPQPDLGHHNFRS